MIRATVTWPCLPRPSDALHNLSPIEAERTAGEYFDRFPWDGRARDEEALSAEEFLARL